ncbi:hypothetical protein [Allohahella sp. A8]|uniref:hypothetical protein n=1 Tax=Allohahella sp. A8 TaxID=3141461 RepID=UPI003A80F86C
MKAQAQFLVLSLCIMLGACSMFQTPVPKTFNQQHAYALTLMRSVNDATASAFKGGYITAKEGQAVNAQLYLARDTINTAADILSTDPEAAEANLERAVKILEQLQIELEKRV